MTPVRCCMAGCRALGKFFEPDGAWWFCSPCYDIHLALRREERAQQRIREVRKVGRKPKPHGTHAAYVRHKARGEQPCDLCRAAETQYQRERYARNKAAS